MKHSILQRLSLPTLQYAVTLLALIALSFTSLQGVNVEGRAYCYSEPCDKCDADTGLWTNPGAIACAEIKSLAWAMKVGVARHEKQDSFSDMSRFGAVEGVIRGDMRTFDEIYRDNYENPFQRLGVYLELDVPELNADIFDPSILQIHSTGEFTQIKDQGHIRQVLTDNGFTDIEKLVGGGFHIRLWNRQGLTLTKTGGFYNLPATTPFQEAIFKRPDGVTGDDELLLVAKERYGARGNHTTTQHFVRDPSADTFVVTTYYGEGISGTAIHKQSLQYSNRGTKVWDYTIEREVFEVTTAPDGTMGSLVKTAHVQETYQDFSTTTAGGERGARRLVTKIDDFGGEDLTTIYTHFDSPANQFVHGRLMSIVNPNGSWLRCEYTDSSGSALSTNTTYSSWKDVTLANYQDGLKDESVLSNDEITRTRSIAGQTISKSVISKALDGATGNSLHTVKQSIGTELATSVTAYHPESAGSLLAGRPIWIEHADGTATAFSYAEVNGNLVITQQTGAGDQNGVTDGSETVTTYNTANQVISVITKDVETGLTLSSRVADLTVTINDIPGVSSTTDSNMQNGLDGMGRPVKWIYNGNSADYSISARGCCGPKYTRSRSGALSVSQRDGLRRVYEISQKSSTTDAPIVTLTAFNGLTTTVTREAGGVTLFASQSTRNLSGLTYTSKSPDADGDGNPETTTRTTTYLSAGGSQTVTTLPDLTTTTTQTYRDGSLKSSTDRGGFTSTFDKGTHNVQGGGLWSKSTQPNLTEFTKTYSDQLGRSFKTEFPDGAFATRSFFPFAASAGSRGKHATTVDADENTVNGTGSLVNYTYNDEGESTGSTTPLPDAQTQTVVTDQDVINDPDLGPSYRSRTWVNTILTSTNLRSGDGYQSESITLAGTSTSSRTIPSDGAWTSTSVNPDGQMSVQTYTNGQPAITEFFDNQDTADLITSTAATYDDFDRSLTTTDSRTGVTTINGYLENGSTTSVTTNNGADTTSFSYDSMGRRITTTLPDSSETYTSYTTRGQVLATWGSQTYAKLYQYDALGRMDELRTYQDLAQGTQPLTTTPDFAATTWTYHSQRGWLTEKNYHGEVGNGPGDAADYAYTLAGRLATRTWERGVTTTYGYDQGLLASVDYSDSTPDLDYTYDDFGRLADVFRGIRVDAQTPLAKHASYTFDPNNLVLTSEHLNRDISLSSFVLTHRYDGLLRPQKSSIDVPSVQNPFYSSSYSYDDFGRLEDVTDKDGQRYIYTYTPMSSSLIETVTAPAHQVKNTWEDHRNILTRKENIRSANNSSISDYTYSVNSIGQRTSLVTSGSAFASGSEPSYVWQYNARGELTEANDSSSANNHRAFKYDGIGNRLKTAEGLIADLPSSNNYTANALNQYTDVTLPAGTGPSVTPAYDLDGNATAYPLPVSQDANAILTWDAENRLVEVTLPDGSISSSEYDYLGRRITKTVTPNGAAVTTTSYSYNGWNIFLENQVVRDASSGNVVDVTSKCYTWGLDLSGSMQGAGGVGGLLNVAITATPPPTPGAATTLPVTTDYYPTYDGNGNVSEYLLNTGSVAAHYEYDAFGNTLEATGSSAADFTHRFSTKPLDVETGLYYYGYRYYDPVTGRWPSRDPIGERGGVNLYGMVGNDAVNSWDFLGREEGGPKRPTPEQLKEQFKADVKKNLAILKTLCSFACPCCKKSLADGDTVAAGLERVKKCQDDIDTILANIEAGWAKGCGNGPLPVGVGDPVGGYLCHQWSRSMKKWADAGNKNKMWSISEKSASKRPKGWKPGDPAPIHVWLHLVPCEATIKKCDRDLEFHQVSIDDGWVAGIGNGKFIDWGPHPYSFENAEGWQIDEKLPTYPDNHPANQLPEAGPE